MTAKNKTPAQVLHDFNQRHSQTPSGLKIRQTVQYQTMVARGHPPESAAALTYLKGLFGTALRTARSTTYLKRLEAKRRRARNRFIRFATTPL